MFFFNNSFSQIRDTANLSKLINIVCDYVEKNDFAALKKMVKDNESFTEAVFEKMKLVHAKINYRTMYICSQKNLVNDKDKYTLGGHSSEAGHIHIDFKYGVGQWRLNKIWLCR